MTIALIVDRQDINILMSLLGSVYNNEYDFTVIDLEHLESERDIQNEFDLTIYLCSKSRSDVFDKFLTDTDRHLLYHYDEDILKEFSNSDVEIDIFNVFSNLELIVKLQEKKMELEEKINTMKGKLLHDSLTGLPNRVLLEDRLNQAIGEAERNSCFVVLIWLDVDNFKNINDSFGHDFGDNVLTIISQTIKRNIRKIDTVARFGGDEFVIVFPGIKEISSIHLIVERLHNVVKSIDIENLDYSCSCSMGVSIYPSDSRDKTSLQKIADHNLIKAKRASKGSYRFSE